MSSTKLEHDLIGMPSALRVAAHGFKAVGNDALAELATDAAELIARLESKLQACEKERDGAVDLNGGLKRKLFLAESRLQDCEKALVCAEQALNDWIVTFADTESRPETVEAAHKRIHDGGGTLYYVATMLEVIRLARGRDVERLDPK